jgi:hypothetical protein
MKKMITVLLALLIYNLTFNNCSAQWVQMSSGMGNNKEVWSLATYGNYIFAGTFLYGVYVSTNNGTNWTQTGLNNKTINCFAVIGNNIFAGADTSGLYISTNNGTSWTQNSLHLGIFCLAVRGNDIFAGTYGGVFLSTDYGTSWVQTALNNDNVNTIAFNGNNIFAGTGNNGVYLSTNNGANWSQTGLNNQLVYKITVNGNNIFAGTWYSSASACIYLSTNNGTNWNFNVSFNTEILSLANIENNILAGTNGSGIYLSTNNGTNWIDKNQGLCYGPSPTAILFFNNYIFIGISGYNCWSVWRRSYTEILGIKPISEVVPSSYSLEQNHPNPFNPSTSIRYEIPKNGFVKLVIFDMLGREVETLVNEKQNAGTYEATFNASQYPSGVYFYRLMTDGFSDTKKMLLIK